MLKKALKHLSQDPVMKDLISKHKLSEIGESSTNLFVELIDIITGQQLSVKAGSTIFNRLLKLLEPKTRQNIVPQNVLNLTHDQLRSVGLSNNKATYIHHLSHAVSQNQIILDQLKTLSDNEVFQQIIKLKGLGPWSAEMFLIFSLGRPDIFSVNDLGLRTAISKLYHLDRDNHHQILKISQKWSPYRSFASRLLWKSLDNT